MNPLDKVAVACRQLLTEQQITPSSPGTILGDIDLLMDYIGVNGLPTRSHQGNLSSPMLAELNTRLSQPIEVNLKRPLMRDYPNIAGLFVLLRVMDLARADAKRLWLHEKALALWASLNPTEQYFALVEAWFLLASDEVLGGNYRRFFNQLASSLRFLSQEVSAQWRTFDEAFNLYETLGGVSTWNAQLMSRFGFIEIQAMPQSGPRTKTRGWLLGKARRTPWGRAVAWALAGWTESLSQGNEFFFTLPQDAGFGSLQPIFQLYFPEWQRIFVLAKPVFHPGIYIFKVSLDPRYHGGPFWRRMAVPAKTTLHSLATAILKAFQLNYDEYLYHIKYRDQFGKERIFHNPYLSQGAPYADEMRIGTSELPENGLLKFHLINGSGWWFHTQHERTEPPDPKVRQPQVLEAEGKITDQDQ